MADTSYGVAWANDNATVFYVRVDEAMRPYQLWRHRVGTDPAADDLVHEEPDERFYLGVGRTKDDRFVLMGLDSKVTSEFRVLAADDPEGRFPVIEPRRQGVEYGVDHDRGDPDGGRPGPVPHRDQRRGRGLPAHGGARRRPGAVLVGRGDPRPTRGPARRRRPVRRPPGGLRAGGRRDEGPGDGRRHRHLDPRGPAARRPPPCGAAPTPSTTPPCCAYEYTSLVTPRSVFDLDLATGESVLRKRQPVLGDFDPVALPHRAALGGGRRRDRGPDLAGLPARPGPARPGGGRSTLPPLRLRLLRGLHRPDLLVAAAQPPRPGLRVRHRPRPGRRRAGPALVRGGQVPGQAQHLHRLRGLRPDAGRRGVDVPRPAGGPGRQRRRPPHGGRRQPGARSCSGPSWPRCPSWTA